MVRSLLIFTLITLSLLSAHSQTKNRKGSLGITIPVIWNNSEATYYQLGSAKHPSNSAFSYGVGVNYLHPIKKIIYGKVGLGYFRQTFKIKRPFEFNDPTRLPFFTKSYFYDNLYWFFGLGYSHEISKHCKLKGEIEYLNFQSLKQKYTPLYLSNASFQSSQNNKISMNIGSMVNLDLGIEKRILHKVSGSVDIILPVFTKWKNNTEFFSLGYSSDEQQIARNKFSIGLAFSCYYHL